MQSGTLNIRRVKEGTYKLVHKAYLKARPSPFKPMCLNWVRKWMKIFRVKLARFDRYLCRICYARYQMSDEQLANPNSEQQVLLDSFRQHKQIIDRQQACYKNDIANLDNRSAVITFDYTTIHEATSFKVKVLNFSVFYKKSGEVKTKIAYFDYMAESKADFRLTIRSWFDVIDRIRSLVPNLQRFNTWSDGGLKTKEIVAYLLKLGELKNLQICVNYFAPYHGHNICDGHFGVCKIQIRKSTGSGIVRNAAQVFQVFSSRKNTHVFLWSKQFLAAYHNELSVFWPFKRGIRRFFRFTLVPTTESSMKVRCHPFSNSEVANTTIQSIFARRGILRFTTTTIIGSPTNVEPPFFSSSAPSINENAITTNANTNTTSIHNDYSIDNLFENYDIEVPNWNPNWGNHCGNFIINNNINNNNKNNTSSTSSSSTTTANIYRHK